MKKNKMLRTASAMLILTIITICIIGGALAKYTTEATGSDTAVVAKFGVEARVDNNLFGKIYSEKAADGSGNEIIENGNGTVSANEKVVAPGTHNKTGMSLSVTGTPEVSTKVSLGAKTDNNGNEYVNSDIYLGAGTYGVMVEYAGEVNKDNIGDFYTYNGSDYVTATAVPADGSNDIVYQLLYFAKEDSDYYPLTWYVDNTKVNKQEDIKTKLEEIFNIEKKEPNTSFNLGPVKVGWEWLFENSHDDVDTILGNMIAAAPDFITNGSSSIAVVKENNGNYTPVTYKKEAAVADSANEVINAYVGTNKVACLTAAFNVSLKVEQVD